MKIITIAALFLSLIGNAADSKHTDYLIKLSEKGMRNRDAIIKSFSTFSTQDKSSKISEVTEEWLQVENVSLSQKDIQSIKLNPNIEHIQPNYKLELITKFKATPEEIEKMKELNIQPKFFFGNSDNPEIPDPVVPFFSGWDPLINNQWGFADNKVFNAWNYAGQAQVVVAVIDTGVDYTHEDLVEVLWRNPLEIPNNNIDDDGNGYIDDVIGWDFVTDDNKPYDLTTGTLEMIFAGGNAGHGTHCAGVVAARAGNGKGIAGVAGVNNIKVMPIRFLSEKGGGTTAGAIRAIKYAVDNGANVLSNSWGSSGEDPNDPDNIALKEIIAYSQARGTLFIAAAGNGDATGNGYNNDNSKVPAFPASYPYENIISVAAIDESNNLGRFSNWGPFTVDIGAPGVKVFSTVPYNDYADTVLEIPFLGPLATWDGTSMATPHVSGAAALFWSKYPQATWQEVKAAILGTVTPINSLQNKTTSGGKLNVEALLSL